MSLTNPLMLSKTAQALLLLMFTAAVQADQQLPNITVTGQGEHDLLHNHIPVSDAGELLRQFPGVDANRMGGKGLDPVIRGMGQNRLNVLLDGAYVFPGCPNRMDPPTAYAALHSYDQIEVSKGVTTLRHGPGGSGGTIVFERSQPVFAEDDSVRGQLGGSYASNGDAWNTWARLEAGNQRGYVRLFGERSESNDYEDGAGNKVWSGYESTQGGVALGWTPNAATWLELSYEETRERDVKFAGAGMDSPESDNATVSLRGRYDWSPLLTLSGNISYSQVDHVMDNYSLRNGNGMRVPTTSDTLTGRLMAEYTLGLNRITTGLNLIQSERDATMYGRTMNWNSTAIMWPDVTQRSTGIFAEVEHRIGDSARALAGIRVDFVDSSADRANEKPSATAGWVKSPADLYQDAYGIGGDLDRDEWLTGAFVRFEQQLNETHQVFVSASRSQRMGDASELYMARNAGNVQWIGNPDLDPETSHQLDIGLTGESSAFSYSAVIFANRIDDYIYRDKGNFGSITRDFYRNISAALYGIELEGALRYGGHWETRAQLNAMRGDNRSDGGTLAQISPYNGQISQHWQHEQWEASTTVRFAAASDRLNTPANEKETAGYAVVDLQLTWRPLATLDVSAGISNLLDKQYANFINRNSTDPINPGNTDAIDEPGRSIWISTRYSF